MARNCSSRSMRGTAVGGWHVGSGGGWGSCEIVWGRSGRGSKGVRDSVGGMSGKEAVLKMKRSRGWRSGE